MHGGMYRYTYTLGTEKYSSADIDRVSVNVEIISIHGIRTVYSPTHDIVVDRHDSGGVHVLYEEFNGRPDRDIDIYYSLSDEQFGAGLLSRVVRRRRRCGAVR